MRELLGGKGANIAEMTRIAAAPSACPAGFTITTEACVAYMRDGDVAATGWRSRSTRRWQRLEAQRRQAARRPRGPAARLGALRRARVDAGDARHGAQPRPQRRVGRGPRPTRTGNERFAWDSYRRFVQMFGNVVRGIDGRARSRRRSQARKASAGVELDTELDADDLAAPRRRVQADLRAHTGEEFPAGPARAAAPGDRARSSTPGTASARVAYRRLNRIPDDWGTAVNVQQMVFGNKGETSGSGVAFSRDERTGEPRAERRLPAQRPGRGRRLRHAQHRATSPSWRDVMPEAHAQLMEILAHARAPLRRHAGRRVHGRGGHLYMLQTRNAKRPAQAAVRFAVDMVAEGLLDRARRRSRTIDADALDALLHPTFDPPSSSSRSRSGVGASPGAAKGAIVFTADEAVERGGDGEDVILVRPVHRGRRRRRLPRRARHPHLRGRQGLARRARRARDGPALRLRRLASCRSTSQAQTVSVNGDACCASGDLIAIDGSTGASRPRTCRWSSPQIDEHFETVLSWADELRRMGVRANADAPERRAPGTRASAPRASACAAPSTCSWQADRQPKMREMIMAGTEEERRAALAELLPLQRADFEGIFEAMEGLPVTIRLLDPPLHEFLPLRRAVRGAGTARAPPTGRPSGSPRSRRSCERVPSLAETNPMIGHARLPPRHPLSGDLRDAGAGDRRRRGRGARAHRQAAARSRS